MTRASKSGQLMDDQDKVGLAQARSLNHTITTIEGGVNYPAWKGGAGSGHRDLSGRQRCVGARPVCADSIVVTELHQLTGPRMRKLIGAVDWVALWMHRIGGLLLILILILILMMWIVVVDVASRALFSISDGQLDRTFLGGIELVSFGLLLCIFFALPPRCWACAACWSRPVT